MGGFIRLNRNEEAHACGILLDASYPVLDDASDNVAFPTLGSKGSGSAKIGKNVMIGGQSGIAGHIQVADGTKISGQSGVTKSINTPNTAVMGTPAYDYTSALRSRAISKNLPELERRIRELEAIIRQLHPNGHQ